LQWSSMWLIYTYGAQLILKDFNGEAAKKVESARLAAIKWAVMYKVHCVCREKTWNGV